MHPNVLIPLSLSWLLLPACSKKQAAPPPPPPAAVTVVEASSETVRITRDLPGRINPLRVSEVRARVPGILLERIFVEGSEVKAGDVLFKIDPAPLVAARESAAAALVRAEANKMLADTQLARVSPLVKMAAASQQDLDLAMVNVKLGEAEIQSTKAALTAAELDLGYATVKAPISGRIGRALVTEGALVGQGDVTLLAVIQQLDPIYFDFTQPSGDLLKLKAAMQSSPAAAEATKTVTLQMEDGTQYPQPGKILFSEVTVDETTGMVTLRAELPNPDRALLPGMFARGRVVQQLIENAITVPQQAVSRGQGGKGNVLVVDPTDHAQFRVIETTDPIGDKWVVSSGLKAGERVVMEGHMKAIPGAQVVPEPFTAPKQEPAAPAGESK